MDNHLNKETIKDFFGGNKNFYEKHGIDYVKIIITVDNMLNIMNIDDIKSIGTDNSTKLASELELYINNLNIEIPDKMPCFWCCKDGRKKALLQEELITDDKIPIIRLLFEYCKFIREKTTRNNSRMVLFSYSISRLYALYARKSSINPVYVFLSSDKSIEATGFHIGNNFWEAELPVLQNLLNKGFISDIIFNIYDIDDSERILSIKHDTIDLPLWRRKWHPMDGENTKISFVDSSFTQKEWDEWRK